MSGHSRWWTVLLCWHSWRAAVWYAVLTRETQTHQFNGGTWDQVSARGRFAEALGQYHSRREGELTLALGYHRRPA